MRPLGPQVCPCKFVLFLDVSEAAMEALQDGLRQRKLTVAELSRVAGVLPSRRLSAALDARSI